MEGKKTILYITREIERAMGAPTGPGYMILSNLARYGSEVATSDPAHVILIDDGKDEAAGTGDLMKDPGTAKAIDDVTNATGTRPNILVFKNTERIEPLARERGWTLLNPPAATSEKIENKLSQISWLGDLAGKYLPPHRIETMKDVAYGGKPFILQWAHGHTGGGTMLIESEADLANWKVRFPERRCRITDYIEGPAFTVNVVASNEKILVSSPSYQITGLAPFTDSKFATIGNDWSLADKLLTAEDKKSLNDMARQIGLRMQQESWRGLFGIDVIRDAATGRLYLIEINARQPASTTYVSQLQLAARANGAVGLTAFEAHLAALLGEPLTQPLIPVTDGAQIVQRITKETKVADEAKIAELRKSGFTVIPYENTSPNADLIRIQSARGIMSGHNELKLWK